MYDYLASSDKNMYGFQHILDEGEEKICLTLIWSFSRVAFVSDIRQIRFVKLSHSSFNLLENWIKSVQELRSTDQDSSFIIWRIDAFCFDEKTTLRSLQISVMKT